VSSRGGDPRWVAVSPVALINVGQAVRWTSVWRASAVSSRGGDPHWVAVSPVALINGGQVLRWTSVWRASAVSSRGGDPRWVAFSPLLPPSGGDASGVGWSGLVFEALPCRRGPNVGSRSHCCGAAGWAIDTGSSGQRVVSRRRAPLDRAPTSAGGRGLTAAKRGEAIEVRRSDGRRALGPRAPGN
jgi:hypothetical protein